MHTQIVCVCVWVSVYFHAIAGPYDSEQMRQKDKNPLLLLDFIFNRKHFRQHAIETSNLIIWHTRTRFPDDVNLNSQRGAADLKFKPVSALMIAFPAAIYGWEFQNGKIQLFIADLAFVKGSILTKM